MLPEKARFYLMEGLGAGPVVIGKMLADSAGMDYDRRPDPERFTLREVLAHLADWEPIWLERIQRMAEEDEPHLLGYDEGQRAIDDDYAHADPHRQLQRFRDGRAKLLAYLRNLPPESWSRRGIHSEWSELNISSMAVLILGHDGYHTKQVAEWLETSNQ